MDGPESGGATVVISGSSFTVGSTVEFGSTSASSVTYDSDSSLTVTTPTGTGSVDVTVTTIDGISSTGSGDRYTYEAEPVPTPTSAPPTPSPSASGYWLFSSDGGVFTFGGGFYVSSGTIHLNKPVVGMASTQDGGGYWQVASDGGVFAFGDAAFHGGTGNMRFNQPLWAWLSTPWVRATGWWPRTAACSPSGTPPTTVEPAAPI